LAAVDQVLTTDRLVLLPVTAADHARLLAHWRVPQVRRFLFDGAVLSVADVTQVIDDSAASFARPATACG
jgi:[ribosomal protein S5]-alanine N-acetyltransferase